MLNIFLAITTFPANPEDRERVELRKRGGCGRERNLEALIVASLVRQAHELREADAG